MVRSPVDYFKPKPHQIPPRTGWFLQGDDGHSHSFKKALPEERQAIDLAATWMSEHRPWADPYGTRDVRLTMTQYLDGEVVLRRTWTGGACGRCAGFGRWKEQPSLAGPAYLRCAKP